MPELFGSRFDNPFESSENRSFFSGSKQLEPDDSSFLTLGKIALIGGMGYAGVRFFPRHLIIRAASKMSEMLGEKVLPISQAIEKRLSFINRRNPVDKDLPELVDWLSETPFFKDIEEAIRVLRTSPEFGGHVNDIVDPILDRYYKNMPQSYEGLRRVTAKDIITGTGKHFKNLVSDERRQYLSQSIHELSRITGIKPERFYKAALGRGLFIEQETGRLVDVRAFRPANILRQLERINIPFTNWRPAELFHFGEFGIERVISSLDPAFASKVTGTPLRSGARFTYAGGKIFETFRGMTSLVGEGYTLSRSTTGMGKAAIARVGAMKEAFEPFSEMLERLGVPENSIRAKILGKFDRFGLSPRYARGSQFINEILSPFRNMAGVASGRLEPAIETEFLRLRGAKGEIFRGPLGRYESISDLPFHKRLMLKLGFEPMETVSVRRGPGLYVNERRRVASFVAPEMVTARKQAIEKAASEGVSPQSMLKLMRSNPNFIPKIRPNELRPPLGGLREATEAEFMSTGRVTMPRDYIVRKRGDMNVTRPVLKGLFGEKGLFTGGRIQDLMNWATYRPTWLVEQLTGMGIKPGSHWLHNVIRVAGGGAAVALAYQALQYLDYKSNRMLGISPIQIGAKAAVESRIAFQHVIDAVGIVHGAQYLEDLMPGLVNSPLSKAIRIFAGGAIGAYKGRPMLGLGIGALTTFDLTRPAKDISEIYRGEKDVPIRANRFWELGRNALLGDRVQYFRPHMLALAAKGYSQRESVFGTEREYWRSGASVMGLFPFPTPENMFGLSNLMDPYRFERMNYYSRPYPLTSTAFENVPFFGPILSGTIGPLFKPRRRMHPELWEDGITTPEEDVSEYRVPVGAGEELGLDETPVSNTDLVSPGSITSTFGNAAYATTEYLGLLGFGASFLKYQLTGRELYFGDRAEIETPSYATSFSREFWERDLGGMFGTTELVRRFIPRRRTDKDYVNPAENYASQWLPGHRSLFENDRDYFINFHRGDPYTKIPLGESRLPGEAYEKIHVLHSGVPGVYDPIDRFMVLADVAPYSEAYRHYKAIAKSWIDAGLLDESWKEKTNEAIAQVAARKDPVFYPRRFSNPITGKPSRDIKEQDVGVMASNSYLRDRAYWLPERLVGGIWERVSRNIPLISAGIGYSVGGPASMIGGAALGGFVRNKLFPYRSAEEEYEYFELTTPKFAGWLTPYESFIRPSYNRMRRLVQGGYIPENVQRRRDIEDYFDHIEYSKFNYLAGLAATKGQMELSEKFRRRSIRTVTALSPSMNKDFWRNIFPALPPSERRYFRAFAEEEDENEREKILSMVPAYLNRIYTQVWQQRDRQYGMNRYNADKENAEYFSKRPLPATNWSGWHPGISLDAVKLRVVSNEGLNHHEFGLWDRYRRLADRVLPEIPPAMDGVNFANIPKRDIEDVYNSYALNDGTSMENTKSSIVSSPSYSYSPVSSYNISMNMPRKKFITDQVRYGFQHRGRF